MPIAIATTTRRPIAIHFGHGEAGGSDRQFFAQALRGLYLRVELAGDALQMAGADDDEHALDRMARRFLAQARRHVAVALGDQRFVERRRFARELVEHAAEEIALLELLDLVFADVLARRAG